MLTAKKRAFGFGALIQTTRNYFKYPNNPLATPTNAYHTFEEENEST